MTPSEISTAPLRVAGPAGGLDSYLGAGRVVRVDTGSVLVALEEASVPRGTLVHAVPALTFPYRSAVGDQLLVIGDTEAFYVIGVLEGRGHTSLSNPRGVSIRADGGALRLVGDRGVVLSGRRIRFEAERLRQLAVTAIHSFGERVTHVRETLKVEAGDVDEHSSGRFLLQARCVVLKTLTNARIKSTTVRVG